jgi:hypothetical protein
MLIVVRAWTFASRRLFNASSKFEGTLRASLDLEVLGRTKFRPKEEWNLCLITNLAEEQQTTACVGGKLKGPASHLDQARRPFS